MPTLLATVDLPYLFLESAATEKASDQGLNVRCSFLLVLMSFPFLPGLPGFVQELGLGTLRYSKHCAAWNTNIKNPTVFMDNFN